MANNFERMMQVVNDTFDYKNDASQLHVTEEVITHLQKLHPATLSELIEDDGHVVWILLIPTTEPVMHRFLEGTISEQQLLDETPVGIPYDALYLCSASVLPEYRKKGIAKKITIEAIDSIRKDNPIKTLFYWPFTTEGEILAESIAKKTGLPLLKKSI